MSGETIFIATGKPISAAAAAASSAEVTSRSVITGMPTAARIRFASVSSIALRGIAGKSAARSAGGTPSDAPRCRSAIAFSAPSAMPARVGSSM